MTLLATLIYVLIDFLDFQAMYEKVLLENLSLGMLSKYATTSIFDKIFMSQDWYGRRGLNSQNLLSFLLWAIRVCVE